MGSSAKMKAGAACSDIMKNFKTATGEYETPLSADPSRPHTGPAAELGGGEGGAQTFP